MFLTGATGLIGRYLLRDYLRRNVSLAVLVRPQCGRSGSERIESIVQELEIELQTSLPRPICLEGEISIAGLGLKSHGKDWVRRNCNRMLHNAASVTFEGGDREKEPWLSNFHGAREVLRFAQQSNIRELHWVSTAYVCGKRAGVVNENDLDFGQQFRNEYEHSKFSAEVLARRDSSFDSLTVYRPGIVVGDSRTGYTNSYHNIYLFLQFTHILSQKAFRDAEGRWNHPIRLTFDGHEELNLVPVDWVAAAIVELSQSPQFHGKTYHLTHSLPTTCGKMEAALAEHFNYYGVEFVGTKGIPAGNPTALEELFYATLAAHHSYWVEHPRFDCFNTTNALPQLLCPSIDMQNLLRLFTFAIQNRFGKKSRSNVRRRTVVARTK